jgi:hypothetical protein
MCSLVGAKIAVGSKGQLIRVLPKFCDGLIVGI